MQALIVAAGSGSRMMPHTALVPKCLMHFAGRRLFDWQIDALTENGISEITVIGGYQSQTWKDLDIALVENPDWADTNMVHSLFCARDLLSHADDLVLSYGDIVFEPRVVRTMLDTPGDIVVAVDTNWNEFWSMRFADPLADAESLSLDDRHFITEIGQKVSDAGQIEAQFMGLLRFTRKGLDELIDFYDSAAKDANWMLGRTKRTCYTTDLLRGMIGAGIAVRAAPVESGWLEFDTPSDLALYESMNADRRLERFFRIEERSR